MSLKWLRPTNYRGDTIVEVMVVLTVLGLAISISYATANTSLLDARQAQENSQAAELISSQVESLRTMASNLTTDPNYPFISAQYCVTNGNTVTLIPSPPAPNPCKFNILYTITITPPAPATYHAGVVGGTFKIVASWPDVEGQGTDTDTLNYNLYQP